VVVLAGAEKSGGCSGPLDHPASYAPVCMSTVIVSVYLLTYLARPKVSPQNSEQAHSEGEFDWFDRPPQPPAIILQKTWDILIHFGPRVNSLKFLLKYSGICTKMSHFK